MAELSTDEDAIKDENATNMTDTDLPNEGVEYKNSKRKYESEGDAEVNNKEAEALQQKEELVCQPCKDERKVFVADGFCVTCGEHLCETCFKNHTVPRLYRNHVLQDKHEMPKEIFTQNACVKPFQMCAIHEHELITSFCNDHDMLCCNKCIELTHPLCEDVKSFYTKCDDMKDGKELQTFLESLNNMKRCFEETRSRAVRHKEETDWYYEQAVHLFKETMGTIRRSDQEQLTQVVNDCEKVMIHLSDASQGLNQAQSTGSYGELFIKMTLLKKHEDIIKKNMESLNSQNNFARYFFLPMNYSEHFGQVLRVPFRKDKLKHVGTECHQLVLFPKQKLLAVGSKKITLLDYSKREQTEQIEYTGLSPCRSFIMHHTDKEVLLLVPRATLLGVFYANMPQPILITKFEQEYVRKTVFTETSYSLIIYNGCNFTAFYTSESEEVAVVELDRDGHFLRTINDNLASLTANGVNYIKQPGSGVYDADNNVMYITDSKMNSVFKMTKDGECHCIVVSERLASPEGIAVCRDGTLMVCCTKSKCVVKVTKEGHIYSFIDLLEFEPHALAYDKVNSLLYVGGDGKEIHTFYA